MAVEYDLSSTAGRLNPAYPYQARYWLGTTSADPANRLNWSATDGGTAGASPPNMNNMVYFTGNGNNPCTFTRSENWGGLSVAAGYTSKIDLADNATPFSLTITNGKNMVLAGGVGGEFDCGNGTYSITNGTFNNAAQVTFTRGGSTLLLNGTCTVVPITSGYFQHVTIAAGAVVAWTDQTYVVGTITVNGTLSIASGIACGNMVGKTVLNSTGRITGDGVFMLYACAAGNGLTVFQTGAIFDVAIFEVTYPTIGSVLAAGTYQSSVKIDNHVAEATGMKMLAGTFIFTGNVELENVNAGGTLTIDAATHDPNIEFRGNVVWDEQAGSIAWTKGDGTITAYGTANQDWDFGEAAIEDLVINKSAGTLTLSEDVDPDSLTQTDGALAVTTAKTVTVAGNAVFNDSLTGVGGAFVLAVTGTNVAHNATITNVNSTVTALTATDNCVDGTGNTAVNFA